ncbi:methionine adenosyltransferase [Granulibacter bethesdensis]|uniref:S-adenosylmethionine synthase n=1 Tax=Granulibacter bethesdensis (strain ATCC BAA-1260 / CGDNIH1) TaxID=391165 RepID=METK_GRABC|nr:methionine adenosyltransferase [Granulibacter bethesdensis]Q0BPF5.1 RecName: Full=S-adenosylmethionine synthase; Short=AdoMet synthase; AltName: Full=MAT; AltName: Full=Methionine adenosyltransferase [Granulibacter bethesdensis CGDNIH1]ABI63297.1 S-adenosylmethionine synthetase [Granulibacter bethesdensis CGDNIH1]AHJ69608.1 S-adenosylmethionine synthetase [Granulibacter bethesdensis]APH53181.1 S-adenosylmethionine synthetase [Granulibacter bethesdensis]APH65870.1 S-adenosylmethionine synthe
MRDKGEYLFTSESVSEGHPDKVADRISDTVLDAFLKADPYARVACETLVTTNRVVLAGETRGPASVTPELLENLTREAIKDIGYDQEGFSWKNADVAIHLHAQSADIAVGVDSTGNKDEGAGDQGIMFGYACRETPALMPAPIYYSHEILRRLTELRKSGSTEGKLLEPDAKSQVTLRYVDGRPVGATSVVVSTQHGEAASQDELRRIVTGVIGQVLPDGWMPPEQEIYVNPTGKFVIGGPDGDAGLTGRKIIVDTYGGAAPHGGGAFSGKDPTKVDRSAAYVARYLAKNVVAAELADRVTLQISYAIGVSHPLSVYVDLHGTGHDVDEVKLEKTLRELVNLSPRGIREHLRLNRPIYVPTSAYGHFGRTPDMALDNFTWEQTDIAAALRSAFNR